MLWMKMKMVMDSLCGRRRRLPCSVWFILLFAAGGLVLFIHQQDLSEMVQQHGPDWLNQLARMRPYPAWATKYRCRHPQCMKVGSSPRQSRETLSTQDRDRGKTDIYQDLQTTKGILSSPIPPMQFPHFENNKQTATPVSPEQDMGSLHVSKRQRKLLKTSPPVHHNKSNISTSSVSSSSSASSSSSDSSSGVLHSFSPESWKRLSSILEERKKLMKEICTKYKSNISKTITHHHVKYLYVEDKYKLLYCQVPKAGCSNWKRTLFVLAGHASNTESIQHDTVHYSNLIKTLDSFNQEGIRHRLQTYTKVMLVREPLERMVSAYRDKFENPNPYYHGLFGKPIISKYRKDPSKESLNTGDGVTFNEFVQYLLDVHRPVGMDIHWEQANQLCHPCLIEYDFIGKFENMEEESNFLLRLVGAPPKLKVPTFKDRNPRDKKTSMQITENYFSQVSNVSRQRVYDFYYMDYLMFNYSKPFKDLY